MRRAGLRSLTFVALAVSLVAVLGARKGDVSLDGAVDATDVLLLQRALRGELSLGSEAAEAADVAPLGPTPGDTNVDGADLAVLLRTVAGDDVDGDGLPVWFENDFDLFPFALDTDGNSTSDALEDSDSDGAANRLEFGNLSLSDSSLEVEVAIGDPNPPPSTFEVCNSGRGPLSWSLAIEAGGTAPISSILPSAGETPPGSCALVTVSFDHSGELPGQLESSIQVSNLADATSARDLAVIYEINELPGEGCDCATAEASPYCVGDEITVTSPLGKTITVQFDQSYSCGRYGATGHYWIGRNAPSVTVSSITPSYTGTDGNRRHGYSFDFQHNLNRWDAGSVGFGGDPPFQAPSGVGVAQSLGGGPVSLMVFRSKETRPGGNWTCEQQESCADFTDVVTLDPTPDSNSDGSTADEFPPSAYGTGSQKVRMRTDHLDLTKIAAKLGQTNVSSFQHAGTFTFDSALKVMRCFYIEPFRGTGAYDGYFFNANDCVPESYGRDQVSDFFGAVGRTFMSDFNYGNATHRRVLHLILWRGMNFWAQGKLDASWDWKFFGSDSFGSAGGHDGMPEDKLWPTWFAFFLNSTHPDHLAVRKYLAGVPPAGTWPGTRTFKKFYAEHAAFYRASDGAPLFAFDPATAPIQCPATGSNRPDYGKVPGTNDRDAPCCASADHSTTYPGIQMRGIASFQQLISPLGVEAEQIVNDPAYIDKGYAIQAGYKNASVCLECGPVTSKDGRCDKESGGVDIDGQGYGPFTEELFDELRVPPAIP